MGFSHFFFGKPCWVTVAVTIGIILTAGGQAALANDVVMIAHPGVGASEVTADEVRDIFLGKKTRWDDGQRIVFAIMPKHPAHKVLLRKYVKKTGIQFRNYWKKMVFTGKGKMPRSFTEPSELIEFIQTNSGSVGYLAPGEIPEGIKVLKVTQ